jgi:hypothetical protein
MAMKRVIRLMWLLVIAGGVMLFRWFTTGASWLNVGDVPLSNRFGPQAIAWTCAWFMLLIFTLFQSRKSKAPAGLAAPGKRFQFGVGTLLMVLAAMAVVLGVSKWGFPSQGNRSTYHTLAELRAKYADFDVVQVPDLPGPYEEIPGATYRGEGGDLAGSFWANGKTRKFFVAGAPGVEHRVVELISQDSRDPTFLVLQFPKSTGAKSK